LPFYWLTPKEPGQYTCWPRQDSTSFSFFLPYPSHMLATVTPGEALTLMVADDPFPFFSFFSPFLLDPRTHEPAIGEYEGHGRERLGPFSLSFPFFLLFLFVPVCKLPGDKFPARSRNKPRSLIDLSFLFLPFSSSPPASLQPRKFSINGAKDFYNTICQRRIDSLVFPLFSSFSSPSFLPRCLRRRVVQDQVRPSPKDTLG